VESSFRECRHTAFFDLAAVESLLMLDRRNKPDRLKKAVVIELPNPSGGGEHNVLQPHPPNDLGLEERDHRLSPRVDARIDVKPRGRGLEDLFCGPGEKMEDLASHIPFQAADAPRLPTEGSMPVSDRRSV
jgi:hypothetical protein